MLWRQLFVVIATILASIQSTLAYFQFCQQVCQQFWCETGTGWLDQGHGVSLQIGRDPRDVYCALSSQLWPLSSRIAWGDQVAVTASVGAGGVWEIDPGSLGCSVEALDLYMSLAQQCGECFSLFNRLLTHPLFQNVSGLSKYCFAYFRHCLLWWGRRERFLVTTPTVHADHFSVRDSVLWNCVPLFQCQLNLSAGSLQWYAGSTLHIWPVYKQIYQWFFGSSRSCHDFNTSP